VCQRGLNMKYTIPKSETEMIAACSKSFGRTLLQYVPVQGGLGRDGIGRGCGGAIKLLERQAGATDGRVFFPFKTADVAESFLGD
jgi:hypothetical protein